MHCVAFSTEPGIPKDKLLLYRVAQTLSHRRLGAAESRGGVEGVKGEKEGGARSVSLEEN